MIWTIFPLPEARLQICTAQPEVSRVEHAPVCAASGFLARTITGAWLSGVFMASTGGGKVMREPRASSASCAQNQTGG